MTAKLLEAEALTELKLLDADVDALDRLSEALFSIRLTLFESDSEVLPDACSLFSTLVEVAALSLAKLALNEALNELKLVETDAEALTKAEDAALSAVLSLFETNSEVLVEAFSLFSTLVEVEALALAKLSLSDSLAALALSEASADSLTNVEVASLSAVLKLAEITFEVLVDVLSLSATLLEVELLASIKL